MSRPIRLLLAGVCLTALPAVAQNALDRVDPNIGRDKHGQPPLSPRVPLPRIDRPESGVEQTGEGVFAGAIRVDGAHVLPVAAFGTTIEPFVGRQLSASDLQALVRAVAGVARAKGYLFAWAEVPPQSIAMGIVRVVVHEGVIDRIRIDGAQSRGAMEALRPLANGQPVLQTTLERRLLLAGDVPGVTIEAARFQREGGEGILIVKVRSRDHAVSARLENDGPTEIGPDRVTLSYDLNGIAFADDALTVQSAIVPSSPRELGYVGVQYTLQPGHDGTVVGMLADTSFTNPSGALRQADTHGRSVGLGFSASHAIVRSRKTSLWVGLDGDYREIDQFQRGGLVRRDRLRTLTTSLNGYMPLLGGRLRAGIGVTQGFDIFGATKARDPLASRRDGDAVFVKAESWANWFGRVAGPFSLQLSTATQIADRPLLAAEEITIGGPRYGRAYDYAERTGDQGVLGSAELQASVKALAPNWVDWAHVYGFADAGVVRDLRRAGGADSLYSAGGGLRVGFLRNFDLSAEAALPIDEDRFASGDRSPRFRLAIGFNFD